MKQLVIMIFLLILFLIGILVGAGITVVEYKNLQEMKHEYTRIQMEIPEYPLSTYGIDEMDK